MSRLDTMARFAEPDETELEVFTICNECGKELYVGESDVVMLEQYFFCDGICLVDHSKLVTLGGE